MTLGLRPWARRLSIPVILLAVLLSAALAFGTAGATIGHGSRAQDHAPSARARTARQAHLHHTLRKQLGCLV
jgi:hypothetical protein